MCLNSFKGSLLGGTTSGKLCLPFFPIPHLRSMAIGVSGIRVGPFLKNVAGESYVTGTGWINVDVTGGGLDWDSFMKSVNGTGSFFVKNGAVKGFHITHKASKEPVPGNKAKPGRAAGNMPEEQDFEDLSAKVIFENGRIINQDGLLNTRGLSLEGKGAVDLARETVDYNVYVDLTGIPKIPYYLRGPFGKVLISLDETRLAKDIVFLPFTITLKVPTNVVVGTLDVGARAVKGTLGLGVKALESIGTGISNILTGTGKEPKEKERATPYPESISK